MTLSAAVARIALVKPDKARGVENLVLQMAQRGQITEKVGFIVFACVQGFKATLVS